MMKNILLDNKLNLVDTKNAVANVKCKKGSKTCKTSLF